MIQVRVIISVGNTNKKNIFIYYYSLLKHLIEGDKVPLTDIGLYLAKGQDDSRYRKFYEFLNL